MSEGAPSIRRSEPIDEAEGTFTLDVSDGLERLWHVLVSMRTGLVLILVLTLLSLIGTMLMQAPPGLASDPRAYATWLDSLRPRYGGWTNVFDALGFLSIFSSIWFKGTMTLLIASVVACAVNRAPRLWKQARHPRVGMTEAFFSHARLHATLDAAYDQEATLVTLERAFRSRHYRTVIEREGETTHLFADRFRWSPFGTVMAHLSLIVVLLGVLVGSAFGFRDTGFAAPIGTKVDVGYGTGLTLVAKSFTDTYSTENGAPSDYQSDLVVYQGDRQVAAQTIRVNEPLRVGDVTFYQSFFGPSTAIQVRDPSGRLIYDEGVPLLWASKDETERIGQFTLTDRGLRVFIASAASGKVSRSVKPGQVQVELYTTGSDTPVDIEVIDQGKPATIGGLDFTFVREHQFTGLIVARDPGVPLVWGGSLLLVLGVCLAFFFPNRRAWARIRRREDGGSVVQLGSTVRHDVAFESEFRRFVHALTVDLGQMAGS